MTPQIHTIKQPGHLVLTTNGAMFIVGTDGQQRPYSNPRLAPYRREVRP